MEKDIQGRMGKNEYHANFIYDILKKEYQSDALYSLAKECKDKANSIRNEGKQNTENAKQVLGGSKALLENAKRTMYRRENDLSLITQYKQEDGTYPIEYEPIYEKRYRRVRKRFFSLTRTPIIFLLAVAVSLLLIIWCILISIP